jgi:hypothetical protein
MNRTVLEGQALRTTRAAARLVLALVFVLGVCTAAVACALLLQSVPPLLVGLAFLVGFAGVGLLVWLEIRARS